MRWVCYSGKEETQVSYFIRGQVEQLEMPCLTNRREVFPIDTVLDSAKFSLTFNWFP